ncbi:MAG: hypothetical protein ACI4OL_01135 [Gemmiger sp.]
MGAQPPFAVFPVGNFMEALYILTRIFSTTKKQTAARGAGGGLLYDEMEEMSIQIFAI